MPSETIVGTYDPRIDKYIETAGAFAKPVLIKFRDLVHQACPDVEESIKWGMPAFVYKGPLCGMAAFKHHCVIGFWKSALLFQTPNEEETNTEKTVGAGKSRATKSAKSAKTPKLDADSKKMNWGAPGRDPIPAKITCLEDLPSKSSILKLIKQAKKLNDDGVKLDRSKTKRPAIPVPKDFASALKLNKKASAVFQAFTPSQQRDYLEWIVQAKKDETRQRRISQAIEWIEEGKSRHWKYERKC